MSQQFYQALTSSPTLLDADTRIINLYTKGFSLLSVADQVGLSETVVSKVLKARNIQTRKPTRQDRETFSAPGSSNGNAKINEQSVLDIRARHAAGESVKDLADAFGLSKPSIRNIVLRLSWRHV